MARDLSLAGRSDLILIINRVDEDNELLKEENARWVAIIKELESRADMAVQALRKGVKNV